MVVYFFLYPEGHLGLTAVIFFVILPLTQVMVVLFAEGVTEAEAVAVAKGDGVGLGLGVGVGVGVGVEVLGDSVISNLIEVTVFPFESRTERMHVIPLLNPEIVIMPALSIETCPG